MIHTTIHTIRHGETAYNAARRYAGTIDVPLNDRGIRDAITASVRLRDMRFDAVVTSALSRSVQTARYLCGEGIRTVASALCNERNYGKMQGLTEGEVKCLRPKIEYIHVGDDDHSLNPPGGESFEELRRRSQLFFRFIMEHFRGASIIVVSHGTFLQQFHGLIRGRDWVESLAAGVLNLELNTFIIAGDRLLNETSTCLVEREQINW